MSQQTSDQIIEAQTSKSSSESSRQNSTTITISSNYAEEKDVATSTSDGNDCGITKNQSTDECCTAKKHYNRLKSLYQHSLNRRQRKPSREGSDIRKHNGLVMGSNKCKKAKCRKLNAICKHDMKFFIRNASIPPVFSTDSSLSLREIYNIENDQIKFNNLYGNEMPIPFYNRDVRAQQIISSNENHLRKYPNMFSSLPITTCDDLVNKNFHALEERDRACYMYFTSFAIILFLIVSYFGVLLFLRITSVPFDE